jgi:hypothetical protein
MEDSNRIIEELILNSPEYAFIITPLLLILIWQVLFNRKRGNYKFNGLEYLRAHHCLKSSSRKIYRSLLWFFFIAIIAVIWIDPVLYTNTPLITSENETLHKNFIVAFDMSPSMNLPVEHKGYGGEDLTAGQEGVTRYETAREALFDFLQRFDGERFGLILFSTEPFLARWPTTDTQNQFLEVLGDNIRRGSGTQLEAFSSLTNIDKALTLAREVLGGEEGAIIMISDTEDDMENLGGAVRILRENNIRLYTIGVGVSDFIIQSLDQQFADDPGFRIFQVDSEEDMREAYKVVSEVEESPLFSLESNIYEYDLRWVLSLIALLVMTGLLWLDQFYFHHSTNAFTSLRIGGT